MTDPCTVRLDVTVLAAPEDGPALECRITCDREGCTPATPGVCPIRRAAFPAFDDFGLFLLSGEATVASGALTVTAAVDADGRVSLIP